MFPRNYRRMVLDGPVDADAYVNDPMDDLAEQSTGFERALGHFFEACARDQAACRGFGGTDPRDTYDALVDQAYAAPIPAGGTDPRAVDGDAILAGTAIALYSKRNWPALAQALADLKANDGTRMRGLADAFWGRLDESTFDPGGDRYFTIGAVEQEYPKGNVGLYLKAGKRSWSEHEHTHWNNGYNELNYGLYPIHARDAFDGPFRIPGSSPTPLVVATTYDPATPYRGAENLVRDLGNARLLTMRGDGHTAYSTGNSACVSAAVDAYVNDGALPAPGTQCTQDVGFPAPSAAAARTLGVPALGVLRPQLHVQSDAVIR
jgi:hypothetical protein